MKKLEITKYYLWLVNKTYKHTFEHIKCTARTTLHHLEIKNIFHIWHKNYHIHISRKQCRDFKVTHYHLLKNQSCVNATNYNSNQYYRVDVSIARNAHIRQYIKQCAFYK